jgi:hypothetical protein
LYVKPPYVFRARHRLPARAEPQSGAARCRAQRLLRHREPVGIGSLSTTEGPALGLRSPLEEGGDERRRHERRRHRHARPPAQGRRQGIAPGQQGHGADALGRRLLHPRPAGRAEVQGLPLAAPFHQAALGRLRRRDRARLAQKFGDRRDGAVEIVEAEAASDATSRIVRFYIPPEARWAVAQRPRAASRGRQSKRPKSLGEQLTTTIRAIVKFNPLLRRSDRHRIDYNSRRGTESARSATPHSRASSKRSPTRATASGFRT